MKTLRSIQSTANALLLLVLFYSCSKDSIEDSIEPSVDVLQVDAFSSTVTSSVGASCVRADYSLAIEGNAYINVGNGAQYKTLYSLTSNSEENIRVMAKYVASAANQELPATITIEVSGITESFSGVTPEQWVTAVFPLDNFRGADAVPVTITQKAFLEPAFINQEYHIVPACPPAIGDQRYGGVIVDIFEPGEDGYVPGEKHGLVASINPISYSTWTEAMETSQNYTHDGYGDWYLPSEEEFLTARNVTRHDGQFWTSTEHNTLYAIAVFAQFSIVFTDVYPKTDLNGVLPVRRF